MARAVCAHCGIERPWGARQQAGAGFDDVHCKLVAVPKAPQDLPQGLDPFEAAADDDNGVATWPARELGEAAPDRVAVVDALERHCMAIGSRHTERVVHAADRDDAGVEADAPAA